MPGQAEILKAKQREYSRRYRERHREKVLAAGIAYRRTHQNADHGKHIKRKYGLSQEEYERAIAVQDNRCGICRRVETRKANNGKVKRLSVDHDHATGKPRGLICDDCNIILGRCKESPEYLERIVIYLKRFCGKS